MACCNDSNGDGSLIGLYMAAEFFTALLQMLFLLAVGPILVIVIGIRKLYRYIFSDPTAHKGS